MPKPSSNSVRVRWPKSKDEVLDILCAFTKMLEETNKVFQVWLFGSYATGEYRYGSDVDLCIVFHDNSSIKYEFLLEMFQEISVGIEVQFHIYERSIFETMIDEEHSFPLAIIGKGKRIL